MKKILFMILLLLAGSAVFAQCEVLDCPAPYGLTSGVSRFFSAVTGQNFLAEKIGGGLIKKAVKKNINSGDIKAKLDSYSVRDLKAGKFKSIEISGKNIDAQGIYITSFNVKTLCDFNYIVDNHKGDVIIKENMPMAMSVTINEDDLNKTMNSTDYKRLINNVNSLAGGFFEVNSTYVRLKNDKMFYIIKYSLPFVRKPKEVVLSADLCVDKGKIILANTSFAGSNSTLDINKFSKLLNYINPLDFSAKILENKEAKVSVENVKIKDKRITIDGRITLLKDKE